MLDRGSDDVTAMRGGRFAQTTNREVIRFSTAGREYDLVRFGVDQIGHFSPGAIDSAPRLLTKAVDAGGVPVRFRQRARHRCRNSGVDGRRRTVIEINPISHLVSGPQLQSEWSHLSYPCSKNTD